MYFLVEHKPYVQSSGWHAPSYRSCMWDSAVKQSLLEVSSKQKWGMLRTHWTSQVQW